MKNLCQLNISYRRGIRAAIFRARHDVCIKYNIHKGLSGLAQGASFSLASCSNNEGSAVHVFRRCDPARGARPFYTTRFHTKLTNMVGDAVFNMKRER